MRYYKFVFVLFSIVLFSSCHVARFFYYNFADVNDYKKFPQVPVKSNSDKFYFQQSIQPIHISAFDSLHPLYTFEEILEYTKTMSFMIIRNDTILYEFYDEKYEASSIFTSFSISKAVISALVGIAIEEHYLPGVNAPITEYIPELHASLAPVTFDHLLNMRSGIRYNENYTNPWTDMPKYYYGKNLLKYISHLRIREEPDLHFDYLSVNTLLVTIGLERATQMPLNHFLEKKLWVPMGMEYDATLNIDSRKNKTIKGFCCLNARTRDFAKLGRLYLNKGNWDGKQLIPEEWVTKSLTITKDSKDSKGYPYVYQWRVLPSGEFFAKGLLGQYIYCDPNKNIIIVRLGKKESRLDWIDFFQRMEF